MLLRWVNHASFVVEHGDVRLLCDPWLSGSAFADGWDLLAKTVFDDFGSVTHIWYSHEHPDHFAPRALKSFGKQTTVLYQTARDGKVLDFCKKQGFATRALADSERVTLAPDFAITCGQVPFYDSWLLIEAGGKRVLNLNDCVVQDEGTARAIQRRVGPIDVLMSQFNDAEWKGNPDKRALRETAAREMLDRLKVQAQVFQPTYMLPFASFFYFSHEENFYLNEAKNRIGDVARFVREHCASAPIVLYPGDTWTVGEEHDNAGAIARYETDAVAAQPIHKAGPSVPVEQLVELAAGYRERIKKANSPAMLWLASNPLAPLLPKVTIYLDDLATAVEFDWRNGLRSSEAKPDISMHSESLAFVLKFDWGMDTLTVNGRFRADEKGYQKFVRAFSPGSLNNIGRRFGFELVADRQFLKRVLSLRRRSDAAP